jgi:uncharacterized protein (TIGR00251 family)
MVKILIKVKPNLSRDEILVDSQNNITIKIRAKPIEGDANEYLVKYLAKEFEISHSLIQIEKGAASRLKRIVLNIEPAQWVEIIRKHKE